jgi:pyrroloquinoline quinone (PQQ) biosynthesis protein C
MKEAPMITPKLLEESRKAQLANLLKKQASGKTLTAREEAAIAEGAGEKAGYATTWDRLAEALGITRRGLLLVRTRHAQAEDLPKPKPDGRHSIDAWRSFFATHGIEGRQMDAESSGSDDASPAAWKARQIEQQVIKLQLANELTKRQQIA